MLEGCVDQLEDNDVTNTPCASWGLPLDVRTKTNNRLKLESSDPTNLDPKLMYWRDWCEEYISLLHPSRLSVLFQITCWLCLKVYILLLKSVWFAIRPVGPDFSIHHIVDQSLFSSTYIVRFVQHNILRLVCAPCCFVQVHFLFLHFILKCLKPSFLFRNAAVKSDSFGCNIQKSLKFLDWNIWLFFIHFNLFEKKNWLWT